MSKKFDIGTVDDVEFGRWAARDTGEFGFVG